MIVQVPTTIITIILILQSFCSGHEPFNIDLRFPLIVQTKSNRFQTNDNGEQNAPIFSSLVAINLNESKVFIGSPNFQFNRSFINGAVFECRLQGSPPGCEPIQINENDLIHETNIQYRSTNKSLFGMNMVLTNDHLIICSPNWVGPNETPEGICFFRNMLQPQSTPIIYKYPRDTLVKSNRPYESHNLFGFSSSYDHRNDQLVFGLPGFKDFSGALCTVHDLIARKIKMDRPKSHTNSYTGFSVEYFPYDGSVAILAATPKFEKFWGKLEIIDPRTYYIILTLYSKNDTIGEFFGASLMVVDLENDDNSEILVGAPFYSIGPKLKEIGRVYLFKNVKQRIAGHDFEMDIIMSPGKKSGSRFGTTMAWIDINLDRFNDVIISAPFEENNDRSSYGAIYIYYGSKHGLNMRNIKRLDAESISQNNVHGFGYNLWTGTDFDSNHYHDLVIGSLMTDKTFVLRTSPIITINASIQFQPKGINFSNPQSITGCPDRRRSCFRVAYCIYLDSYSYQFFQHELSFNVQLTVPDRNLDLKEKRVINDRLNQTIRTKDQRFCSKINDSSSSSSFLVELKEKEEIFDVITPIEVQLTVELQTPRTNDFCSHCPVANLLTIYNEIGYEHGCASQICVSKIILTVDLKYGSNSIEQSIVEGQYGSIDIKATLVNHGETSINTLLMLLIDPVHLTLIPGTDSSRCVSMDAENGYKCEIKKIMVANQKEELILRLDTQTIESRFLYFDLRAKTSSRIDHDSRLRFSRNITIIKEARFAMNMRLENHYNFTNFVHKVLIPISIVVEKSGPSNIDGAYIEFEVPWMIEMEQPFQYRCNKIKHGMEKASNYALVNYTLQMECAQDPGGCTRFQCKLDRFKSGTQSKNFDITLSWISSRISPKINYRRAHLETSFKLLSNDSFFESKKLFDDARPLFVFYKQDSEESSRSKNTIIFGSAGLGILIILLTTIILCKYGFFKRKKLEELKRVHQRMSMNPNMFQIPMMDNNVNEINQIGYS